MAIVKQVMSGNSGQLVLPEAMTIFTGIRGWPSWMQIGFRNLMAPLLDFPETDRPF